MDDTTYYAIGDVHGMDDMLGALHEAILADIKARRQKATIVHLGDYVDRGPHARLVIERLMRFAPRGVDVINLGGNHEAMMVEACRDGAGVDDLMHWLGNGGRETLASYGPGDLVAQVFAVPKTHLRWLARRPHCFKAEAAKLCFVHAGVEPAAFPDVDAETAHWTRSPRFFQVEQWGEALDGWLVVHGHTPTLFSVEAWSDGPRLNIDDGACFGDKGRLTAVRIDAARGLEFFHCAPNLMVARHDAPLCVRRSATPAR